MRSIKRKFKGELPREYHECQLYYKKQRKYFKDLKPYRNKDRQGMKRVPGKTSAAMPGIYNGLH